MANMKKTLYYNFFPTKEEEEEAGHQVKSSLVEIREAGNGILIDPNNHPWQIRKSISPVDAINGMLTLSHDEMFEYVFRYWPLIRANSVEEGQKSFVALADYSEESVPTIYRNEKCYVEKGPQLHTYSLACMELFRSRLLNAGDEVGLFWDLTSVNSFRFKLLKRAANLVSFSSI